MYKREENVVSFDDFVQYLQAQIKSYYEDLAAGNVKFEEWVVSLYLIKVIDQYINKFCLYL